MFVDSHCHLNYKGLVEDQAAVLTRARGAGVSTMLNISTRAAEWDEVIAVAERESDVWASVGVHPHDADTHAEVETETLVARQATLASSYRRDRARFLLLPLDRDRQRASFARISPPARDRLPIIVHTRGPSGYTAI